MRNLLQALNRSKSKLHLSEEGGLAIGLSVGEERKAVYLPEDVINHHTLVVGKAGTGKTTLLSHLAVAAMERGDSVLVFDADGDLVPALLGRVPQERVGQVFWVDWGETSRRMGMNWLDMNLGLDTETIVSSFIHVGPLIWKEAWSPSIEEALAVGLRTLLTANRALTGMNQPQFTCLELAPLFDHENFRHNLLEAFVDSQHIRTWWEDHLDHPANRSHSEWVDALLTRLRPFTVYSRLRYMLMQSQFTLPLQADPRQGIIVFVGEHLPNADRGEGREALASLLLKYVLAAIEQHGMDREGSGKKQLTVVLNGSEGLPDLATARRLAALEKLGVTFLMSTQGVGEDEAQRSSLFPILLENVRNLFVFRTTGHDAQVLRSEMASTDIDGSSLSRIPDHIGYLRTHSRMEPPQSFPFEVLPPVKGDPQVAATIKHLAEGYTKKKGEACNEWLESGEQYYHSPVAQDRDREGRKDERQQAAGGMDQGSDTPVPQVCNP